MVVLDSSHEFTGYNVIFDGAEAAVSARLSGKILLYSNMIKLD